MSVATAGLSDSIPLGLHPRKGISEGIDTGFALPDVIRAPKTLTEVTRDAAELPVPEQLRLARILLELSETDPEAAADVQNAWDTEIERRLAELRSGKVKGVPLEEVKKKIEAAITPARFCSLCS